MMGRRTQIVVFAAMFLAGCGSQMQPVATVEQRARTAQQMLSGITQDGTMLGRSTARATLIVFTPMTDLNGGFLRSDLPELIRRYVRPGRLRIMVRTIRSPNQATADDSERLNRLAQAVGLQDRFWNFYLAFDAIYDGSSTSQQEARALTLTPGLDRPAVRADATSARIDNALRKADTFAAASAVEQVPSYFLARADGTEVPIATHCDDCLVARVGAAIVRPQIVTKPKPKATATQPEGKRPRPAKAKAAATSR